MKRKPAFSPSARDRQILQAVFDYRFLDSSLLTALLAEQAGEGRRFGFGLAGVRARCHLLREHEYLVAQFLQDQPIGRGYREERGPVYSVGPAAVDYLAESAGLDKVKLKSAVERNTVTSFFLRHFLGISKFRACMALACRQSDGTVRTTSWLQDGLNDAVTVDTDNGPERIPVVPDAAFNLIVERPGGATVRHFFLEYDRGTMPLADIARKACGYWHYAQQGQHRQRYTYAGSAGEDPTLRFVSASWQSITDANRQVILDRAMQTFQVLFVTQAKSGDRNDSAVKAEQGRVRQCNVVEAVRRVPDIPATTGRFLFATDGLDFGLNRPAAVLTDIWEALGPAEGTPRSLL